MKKRILPLLLAFAFAIAPSLGQVETGADRMGHYLEYLRDRKVGLVANHTSLIGGTHLVDTLLTLGIRIEAVFAPEHGFRGDADAGEHVKSFKDPLTGIDVISLYGANRRPDPKDFLRLDIVVFDMQDVGTRFYTYISTMHYVMEVCAQTRVPLIILDRPNPKGAIVDGPVREDKHRSFVGMHPIPVLHGMTLGELAMMINGEGWLASGVKAPLMVIPCSGWKRGDVYELPVPPSPNLKTMDAIYLYPSLCYFEGTIVSVGRGTDNPFTLYGHPDYSMHSFSFIPRSVPGAKNPPLLGKVCHGRNLSAGGNKAAEEALREKGVDLSYLLDAYYNMDKPEGFFTPFFEKLIGVDYVRQMIIDGYSAQEISQRWKDDIASFKKSREKYLLYYE